MLGDETKIFLIITFFGEQFIGVGVAIGIGIEMMLKNFRHEKFDVYCETIKFVSQACHRCKSISIRCRFRPRRR